MGQQLRDTTCHRCCFVLAIIPEDQFIGADSVSEETGCYFEIVMFVLICYTLMFKVNVCSHLVKYQQIPLLYILSPLSTKKC